MNNFINNIINQNIDDKSIMDDNIKNKNILSKDVCFKIFHAYKFNNISMDELASKYNVNKDVIRDVVNGKGDYHFLKPPINTFNNMKSKNTKVYDKENKCFMYFKNNSIEYYNYLKNDVGCDPLKGGPDGIWQKPWNPISDEEYNKLKNEYEELLEVYNKLYD